MNNFDFRFATISDALRLSILYQQVYIQTYGVEGVSTEFANFISKKFSVTQIQSTIELHPNSIIVASYNEHLVGVASIEWESKNPITQEVYPELGKLYILDWFSGKGIGQKLIALAEKTLKENGYQKYWLWVLYSNQRAIQFYFKQHFEHIGNADFQMEVNAYENLVLVKQLVS